MAGRTVVSDQLTVTAPDEQLDRQRVPSSETSRATGSGTERLSPNLRLPGSGRIRPVRPIRARIRRRLEQPGRDLLRPIAWTPLPTRRRRAARLTRSSGGRVATYTDSVTASFQARAELDRPGTLSTATSAEMFSRATNRPIASCSSSAAAPKLAHLAEHGPGPAPRLIATRACSAAHIESDSRCRHR
jgi:hypothetical protein